MINIFYLDNAATTAVNNKVLKSAMPYFTESFGNPSSLHEMGKRAKDAIQRARIKVAESINAEPNQIFFFSSATEANNAIINNFNICDCSPYEHSSVYHIHHDCIPELYSHMMVNNETGDIYDIKTLCKLCHDKDILFHTDATQAFGKISIDVKDLNVDFLTFSGHKIHSLKGCAVLYIKNPVCFISSIFGGMQEQGIHPGTENVPAIVAIGEACELFNYDALFEDVKYNMNELNHDCIKKFIDSGLDFVLNGVSDKWIDTIINISFKNIDGETLQYFLNRKDVYISTSSACSSGHKKSRVLANMNVPDDYIYGAIRISFSLNDIVNRYEDYREEILDAIDIIIDVVKELSTIYV